MTNLVEKASHNLGEREKRNTLTNTIGLTAVGLLEKYGERYHRADSFLTRIVFWPIDSLVAMRKGLNYTDFFEGKKLRVSIETENGPIKITLVSNNVIPSKSEMIAMEIEELRERLIIRRDKENPRFTITLSEIPWPDLLQKSSYSPSALQKTGAEKTATLEDAEQWGRVLILLEEQLSSSSSPKQL